jgi:iron complex transport system substrate-binding protein
MRVVSLLPAATEIVAFLGHADKLVGLSHECNWPPGLPVDLPRLTEPRIEEGGSSREIDEAVRDVVSQGLSVYELDVDRLVELDPDVVVTQDQCSVCAVDLEQVESSLADRLDGDVEVVSLSPNSLGDILENIVQVAEALGAKSDGIVKRRKLASKLDRAVGGVPSDRSGFSAPEVCFVEWIDPLMVAGHWIPEMIEKAGGRYSFVDAGAPSRQIEFEELQEVDPEVIVIAPCGMGTLEMRGDLGALTDRDGWDDLQAVQRARVHPVDGDAYFNRPGPRILDSLSILVRLLWPAGEHPDETADKLFSNGQRE